MIYFIDTNIFLRTLINDNARMHQSCIEFLSRVKTNTLYAKTATIVLAEAMWTLMSYYQLSRDDSAAAVQSIINLRGLTIVDQYNHSLAIKLFQSSSVKYIDALIASISPVYQQEWTVISYDKDFDNLDIPRKEP